MTSNVLIAVDADKVNPGLLGFLVVAALGVATWFLIRSMTRHLRRIDFPEDDEQAGAAAPDTPDEGHPTRPNGPAS